MARSRGWRASRARGTPFYRPVERLTHAIGHRIVQPGQEPVPVDIGQFRVVRGMIKRGQDCQVNLARVQEQQAPDERSRVDLQPCRLRDAQVVGRGQVLLHVLVEPGGTRPRRDQAEARRRIGQIGDKQSGSGPVARRRGARNRAQQPGQR